MPKPKLNPRERKLVLYGSIGGAIMLLYGFLTWQNGPIALYQRSANQLADARSRLEQAQMIQAEVAYERQSRQQLQEVVKGRPASYDLFTFVNRAIREANLNDRAPQLQNRPVGDQFEGVQITLSGVSIDELIRFLHRVYEADSLVMLDRLDYLREARDGRGLDCSMVLKTPRV